MKINQIICEAYVDDIEAALNNIFIDANAREDGAQLDLDTIIHILSGEGYEVDPISIMGLLNTNPQVATVDSGNVRLNSQMDDYKSDSDQEREGEVNKMAIDAANKDIG